MQTSEPSSTSLGGDLPEFDNSTDPSGEVYCSSCGAALPSRNRLFAHLAAAHGLRRPDEVKAPKVAADDHLERGLQRETIEGLRFVMETRGEGRSPVRLDWVCTIPRVRQSLILWLRSKMLAGVLPQHAPRSGGWWKIAIVEFLKFMQDRSEIFEVGQLGGPQAPENGEGIRLRQTLVGLSDSAWQQTDQLQDESQEQLAGRVLTVLQAMQADPVKKRFSYQLLSEVAQDRGVQRLLHGRVLSKTLAGDARFEVKEDPRHGITIRLSGDSVVRKGTTDAGTSPSAASMVSILARHEGYAVALDKPAGLTTEELIHHFESQEKPEGPLKSVSRLDAPTSGALVVPLCQDAMEDLKDHFSARRVTKAYLALVLGEPPKHGQIDVKLRAVQSVDRYRAVVHPYGKEAVTSFQRLAVLQGDEHHDSYSLVLAWPLTGRMHQIRAHFAHLGFPLAGDVRYAPRKGSTAWSGERLFLHAAFISVPSSLTAVSPLKVDLLEPLKELKIDPQLLQQLQAPKFYLERAAKAASLSSSESSSASDDSDDEHLQSLLAKENVTDPDPAAVMRPVMSGPSKAPQPQRPDLPEMPQESGCGYIPGPQIPDSKPLPQILLEQSGGGAGAVVATVGCSVLGFMMAGPVGAVIGGGLAIAAASATKRSDQRLPLGISNLCLPQDQIVKRSGITYFTEWINVEGVEKIQRFQCLQEGVETGSITTPSGFAPAITDAGGTFAIEVPPGVVAGQELTVRSPDGSSFRITVPDPSFRCSPKAGSRLQYQMLQQA
ncbi:Uncharacterized RNA pseudouridine synthase Caur_0901 (RNA pseudouridylate synthase) (RNA-uridine isomerase) [Durusdinium trenchii]|uniref:Uncharacterized RNA pseudouridine synthase Caur_0901 (RNA pseudouridylate synthase) (RNA-uridine isomerase) n=1 Tax=Durusdinium trenchii TaxID=1381693 RepID=A0ABP0RDA8_9DINO